MFRSALPHRRSTPTISYSYSSSVTFLLSSFCDMDTPPYLRLYAWSLWTEERRWADYYYAHIQSPVSGDEGQEFRVY